jgi:hypothetical protein
MRLARGFFPAQFFASATGFSISPQTANQDALYLTIRYKDINFNPALDRFWGSAVFANEGPGASVAVCPSSDGCPSEEDWLKIGSLGGSHDMTWKTKTLEIPAGMAASLGGEFKFRIGTDAYGPSDTYGELAVDWIKLSDVDETPSGTGYDTDYDATPGFWPPGDMNARFADFPTTGYLHEGEPFFPIGLFTVASHFFWQSDTNNYLTNARDTGFNTVIYHGWEAHSLDGGWFWGEKDVDGTEEFSVEDGQTPSSYPSKYLGLPNFLDYAQGYGLKVAPLFMSDMWSYYIYRMGRETPHGSDLYGYPNSEYNGTFPGVVKAIEDVVQANKDHPALLFWYLKDEADMQDEGWGSPLESVRWLYQTVTEADGLHPCLVTNMGWRPQMFRYYMKTFDIGAYDRYTSDFSDGVNHDNVAEWAEEFKYQTGNQRLFMPILQTEANATEGRFGSLEAIRIGTYLGLIHGGQGVLYFDDPGPNSDLGVYAGCGSECGPQWWDELADLIAEVEFLGMRALHNSRATTLGTTWGDSNSGSFYPIEHTTSGDGTTGNTQIHALFRRNDSSGDRYLLAVNPYEASTSATFAVAGMKAGETVQVLFEDRTIVAVDGGFSDTFARGESHVYLIGQGLIFADGFESGDASRWN